MKVIVKDGKIREYDQTTSKAGKIIAVIRTLRREGEKRSIARSIGDRVQAWIPENEGKIIDWQEIAEGKVGIGTASRPTKSKLPQVTETPLEQVAGATEVLGKRTQKRISAEIVHGPNGTPCVRIGDRLESAYQHAFGVEVIRDAKGNVTGRIYYGIGPSDSNPDLVVMDKKAENQD